MKVKCIVDEYFDRELEKYIKKNEVHEMKEPRAKLLIDKGFVKEVKRKPKDVE